MLSLTDADIAAVIRGRVQAALDASTLSAAEVARELDVTPACISNWRAGRREISAVKLIRLAAILNVALEDLMPALELPPAAPARAG